MRSRWLLLACLTAAGCGGDETETTHGTPTGGTPPVECGDGLIGFGEACDDGADNGSYAHCRADCSGPGPSCGDGVTDAPNEGCDDGADGGSYGHCRADCSGPGPSCGDGVTDAPDESCDDGADNGVYGHCATDCTVFGFPFPRAPAELTSELLANPPACAENDWLAKYLSYRQRFRGDGSAAHPGFVSVGSDAGQSIPASRREPDTHCAGHWAMLDCPRPELADARGRYNWGDATIWLGIYLELLATEHALLAQLGVDTTETDGDLALALGAFNRLDEAADVSLGYPPTQDGFFQRDDVPIGFYLDDGGGYRFPRADDGLSGYECVSSTAACPPLLVDDGSFESQDQVMGLLHGLALIFTLVPDDVSVEGLALRYEARAIVHRMVGHLREHAWWVTAPNGDSPPDAWGGNAHGFSDQLARAANRLAAPDFGIGDYTDLITSSVGVPTFNALEVGWDLTLGYNRTHALRMQAINGDWSSDDFARRAVLDGKDSFALSYALVQQRPAGAALANWRVESLLASAPCPGPCSTTSGCADPLGWMSEHRFTNPLDRFGSRHWQGEFTGLDYLVLHNLYLLYRGGAYQQLVPPPAAGDCSAVRPLDSLLDEGVSSGERYDPSDPCALGDLARPFCGRSWADWVDAAYRGEVTVFVGPARLECQGAAPCELVPVATAGSEGDDLLLGTALGDELDGGGGADCIIGRGGDDLLVGGDGADELHGDDGDDTLRGDRGDGSGDGAPDVLFGGAGSDDARGGAGNDELRGDEGNDTLAGEDGHDVCAGGPDHDVVFGGAGDDALRGGDGDDELRGEGGDDSVWGQAGRDKLAGGAGDDYLSAGSEDDFLQGGAGADALVADAAGLDRLCGGDDDDVLWGGWDGDECLGAPGTDQVNGCSEGSATSSECSDAAFDAW